MAGMRTSYDFTLPRGYVDDTGRVHKTGTMRLATARDELEPLRNPSITGPDDPRLTIMVLGRVVERLGDVPMVTEHEIEGLFAVDLAFLQDFYGVINFGSQEEYEALVQTQAQASLVGDAVAAEPRTEDLGDANTGDDRNGDDRNDDDSEPASSGRAALRSAVEELPRRAQ